MTRDCQAEFRDDGFLSAASAELTATIRELSAEWFDLAVRANCAFQQLTVRATETVHGVGARDPKVVATLLAVRCAGNIQGALLMAERGMVIESRTLVRSLIENAFCLGALHDAPEIFLEILRKDDEASRKAQGSFILANDLLPGGAEQRARLEAVVAAIEKVRNLPIKDVAHLSPVSRLYLSYRVLSHDSAHVSARSLVRHLNVQPDQSGWSGFSIGPMMHEEADDCLLLLLQGLTAAGVAITQILADSDGNGAIARISAEMRSLAAAKRGKD